MITSMLLSRDALAIAGVVLTVLILALLLFTEFRLRHRHEETWKAFGRPRLLSNSSPLAILALVAFMLTGKHKALNDRALSLAAYGARALLVVAIDVSVALF